MKRWNQALARIVAPAPTMVALNVVAMAIAGAAIAATPSVTSLSFLVDARSTNTFLVDADALAETQAGRAAMRAFARRETGRRAAVIAELVDWAEAQQRQKEAAAAATTIDRLGGILGFGDDRIVIDATPHPPGLSELAALGGAAFDDLYVASHTRALEHLVALYKAFILNGDDETLRALAVHDLPHAERLLAEVRRLR